MHAQDVGPVVADVTAKGRVIEEVLPQVFLGDDGDTVEVVHRLQLGGVEILRAPPLLVEGGAFVSPRCLTL